MPPKGGIKLQIIEVCNTTQHIPMGDYAWMGDLQWETFPFTQVSLHEEKVSYHYMEPI